MPRQADPADEAALRAHAMALADAIDDVLAGWVLGCVERVMGAWLGSRQGLPQEVRVASIEAAERARAEFGAKVRELLALDIDEQSANPLALLRRAVSYPTEVLRAAGVPPVVRDAFDERAFPGDIYGLAPANFADIDPSLAEPALAWGAAKAYVHLVRRA